jgi:hypothetical protein
MELIMHNILYAILVLVVLVLCAYYGFMYIYYPEELKSVPFEHAGRFFKGGNVTLLYVSTLIGCVGISLGVLAGLYKYDSYKKNNMSESSSLLEYKPDIE